MHPLKATNLFGSYHRALRGYLGLTRKELAQKLNEYGRPYSASAIAKYENGDRNVPFEYVVALRCVGITEHQLLALAEAHCEDYKNGYLSEIATNADLSGP